MSSSWAYLDQNLINLTHFSRAVCKIYIINVLHTFSLLRFFMIFSEFDFHLSSSLFALLWVDEAEIFYFHALISHFSFVIFSCIQFTRKSQKQLFFVGLFDLIKSSFGHLIFYASLNNIFVTLSFSFPLSIFKVEVEKMKNLLFFIS